MEKYERLDKYLSHAGVGARRDIKPILKQHEVTVNGKRIKSSGTRINPAKDIVCIDGEQLIRKDFVYYLLNKPIDVISTVSDYLGRNTVVDLIDTTERIYPIGRLDRDTRGLLLLTNDGALTHQLIHPKYHVPKVYLLTIEGQATDAQLAAFKKGVLLRDGITLPAEMSVVQIDETTSVLQVTLHEGRNRQIRRMCKTVGINLLDLQRIAFGPIALGDVKEGEYRELTTEEVEKLKKAVHAKS